MSASLESSRNLIRMYFTLLLSSNLYAFLVYLNRKSLDYDYDGYVMQNESISFYALFCVLAVLFFVRKIYDFGVSIGESSTRLSKKCYLKKNMSVFVLVYQIAYIAFNFIEGVNFAGLGEEGSDSPLNYVFLLIRPDFIFILYYLVYEDSRLQKINVIVYLFSMISRGWLGGVADIIIIAIAKKNITLRNALESKWIYIALLVVLVLPVIMQIRNQYRLGGIDSVSIDNTVFGLEMLFSSFDILLLRFQQLYSLMYFFDNVDFFSSLSESGKILPLYAQGSIPSTLYKMFVSPSAEPLGLLLASSSRIIAEGRTTAFTTGLIPYFTLGSNPINLIAFCFYFIFVPLFLGLCTATFDKWKSLYFILFFYMMKYFFAAWGSALFAFFTALVFFVFIHKYKFVFR